MFTDRKDAGEKLARALDDYRREGSIPTEGALVLAIPRGGVRVGYQVADYLDADFSLLIARKLPYPHQPEAGFGAIAEDGSVVILEDAARWISDQAIERIIAQQEQEIERRIEALRRGQPLPSISGRTVILVDDGIAMGSTMRAAIQLCKHQGAARIVLAVPVASSQVEEQIGELVDELVVLETPQRFYAVAQVYRNWHDVPDSEVLAIMQEWCDAHKKGKQ